jgi:hypothetical protein
MEPFDQAWNNNGQNKKERCHQIYDEKLFSHVSCLVNDLEPH